MPTMRDYVGKRIPELMDEKGITEDEAEEYAFNEWNDALTESERDRFLDYGFEEVKVDDNHPIMQKIKRKEMEIKENYNNKDFYGEKNNGFRILKDMVIFVKEGETISMEDKIGILMPKQCSLVNGGIDRIIQHLEQIDLFNKGKTEELKDLKEIKKLL